MLSPRSWACTYTSDTHKKPKNARWVDGILEVSFFGATERFAKLYAADDDNKPVGAPVARRKLVDAEFDAVTEGDPVLGLEGFDVHPDEEIHETNQEPSIKSEANEDALEKKTRRVPLRRAVAPSRAHPPPRSARSRARRGGARDGFGALRRPTRDRRRDGRARNAASRSRRRTPRATRATRRDARAALARFAGDGSGAFADRTRAVRASPRGKRARVRGTAASGTALLARASGKYAAFDTKAAIPTNQNRFSREDVTETGVVSHLERDARETAERPPGGVSDRRAAGARRASGRRRPARSRLVRDRVVRRRRGRNPQP